MQDKFEKNISNWKIPALLSKKDAWEMVNKKISLLNEKQNKTTKILPLFSQRTVWVSMAASIALILSMVFILGQNNVYTIEANYGEKERIILPDGSSVVLNAGSSLSFDKKNFNKNRTLELKGEGFFHVEKGSTFSVRSDKGKVIVLGTSFNIYDRGGIYRVSCETGKVKVEQGTTVQFLTEGLKTESLGNDLKEPVPCDVNTIKDWFEIDTYHFENVSLTIVFQELERQFNIKNDLEEVPSDLVNADVRLKNIDTTLDIICSTFGLEFRSLSNDHYVISKK